MISDSHNLPDATAFAYRDGIYAGSKADVLSVQKEDINEEAEVFERNSERESSESNDKKNLELSDLDLKTGGNPEQNESEVRKTKAAALEVITIFSDRLPPKCSFLFYMFPVTSNVLK